MKKIFLIFSVLLFVSGCGFTTKNIVLETEFNPKETKKLLLKGDNKITGSAFVRQRGGGVVTCAGEIVDLMPVTEYSKERQKHIHGNTTKSYKSFFSPTTQFTDNPKEFFRLAKRTNCDAQGHFEFNNIADGSFFVLTRVKWHVGSYSLQGGFLMQKVHVSNKETKNIVLSP